MMMVPMMAVIPIATTNPEDAIDGTHGAADTGADRTANDRAYRASRAAALAHAVLSAALHAADDALRVAGMGHRKQCQSERRGRKRELDRQTGCPRRCHRLRGIHLVHLNSLHEDTLGPAGWTRPTPTLPKGCATMEILNLKTG
jgi:hypothetical protein